VADELEKIESDEDPEEEAVLDLDADSNDDDADIDVDGDESEIGDQLSSAYGGRDRVQEICSMLIANGYVHKDEFRDLLFDEHLREAVSMRLDRVGMKLLHNIYGDHWGIGLNEATTGDERIEWSNNFGLDRGAMALMLIVWCKLVLPKRLAQESRQPEDGTVAALFPEIEKMPNPQLNFSRDQLVAEFGEQLGGITMTGRYLTQLARAKLIKLHGGVIEEGPLLALVVDEARLGDELRREVLLSVLQREQRVMGDASAVTDGDDGDDENADIADY
jgi:hypothetical protein